MSEIITPTSAVHDPSCAYSRYYFDDGTASGGLSVAIINFEDDRPTIRPVIDGESVPSPNSGRYLYSERIADLALEYWDVHGVLPEWVA